MKESFFMTQQEDKQNHLDGFRMTEAENIRVCLNDFCKIVNPAMHKQLLDMFRQKDIHSIAIMLGSVAKEWQNILIKKNNQIEALNKKIETLKMQLEEKNKVIDKLSEEKNMLEKIGRKTDMETLKSMRHMYENGASLRKIGNTFHMDKSTVKRKLIQMGVTIRNK